MALYGIPDIDGVVLECWNGSFKTSSGSCTVSQRTALLVSISVVLTLVCTWSR